MTPTLLGRLQTRWVLLATVGLAWVLAVGPTLPLAEPDAARVRVVGVVTLAVTAVVGTFWELLYHVAQQWRWDKDWPTLLGLVLGLPEGAAVYQLLVRGVPVDVGTITPAAFAWQFGTVWLFVWAMVSGPIRIVFPRWRFEGGRFW
ncbi:MAG: hypothetical protein AAGG08_01345 [Actinomycetota bacterium]